MIRPRGPRTTQHLAARERPGEITIVLWFTGFSILNGLASTALSWAILAEEWSDLPWIVLFNGVCTSVLWAAFVGLRRATPWGFWISWTVWGLQAVGCALACLLSLLNPDPQAFFGSLTGTVTFGVSALFCAGPFLLLATARRRYFAKR